MDEDLESEDVLGDLPLAIRDDFLGGDVSSSFVSGWDDETEGVEEELSPHCK